jgi:hypothetical protein
MTLWRTVNVGRWSAMVGPSVRGRCYLICHNAGIVFSACSLAELVAQVTASAYRHTASLIAKTRFFNSMEI